METKICTKCGEEKPVTEEYFNKSNKYIDGYTYYCKVCISGYKKQYYQKNKDKLKSKTKTYEKNNKAKIAEYKRIYRQKNKSKLLKYFEQYRKENIKYISKYKKQWAEKNKDRLLIKYKQNYIENREVVIERSKEYSRNNMGKRIKYSKKYYENNKEKHADRVKRYTLINIEKITERRRQWKKNNKDKVNISTQRRYAKKHGLSYDFDIIAWESCKKHFGYNCCYCGKPGKLTQEHFIPLSKDGEYTINNIVPACKSCNSKKHNKDFFKWYSEQSFYNKKREQKILKYLNYDPKTKTQQLALTY